MRLTVSIKYSEESSLETKPEVSEIINSISLSGKTDSYIVITWKGQQIVLDSDLTSSLIQLTEIMKGLSNVRP